MPQRAMLRKTMQLWQKNSFQRKSSHCAKFGALLALENKAVVQVVFLILRETIGWADENGRHRRREWVQLGQKHFEITCGSKSQGFYGVKTAIQKGYILRRPYKNTFEYSIRWKENES